MLYPESETDFHFVSFAEPDALEGDDCFEDEDVDDEEEDALDDGRFGLNNPEDPVTKAASLHLHKEAAIEPSGITDPENGGQIYVSTMARIGFRKANPDWARVRNVVLNKNIANEFAKGQPQQYFKPKKGSGSDVGEVRLQGQTKYIGIIFGSDVRIIAVKGTLPTLPKPPDNAHRGLGPAAPVDFGDAGAGDVKNVGDALKGN